MSAESDGITTSNLTRGDSDDFHSGEGLGQPAEAIFYYLKGINDPLTPSTGTIDGSTFVRSVTGSGNLPAGHTWAVSGNREVGEQLGLANTQSVMYGLTNRQAKRTSLTADDVYMLKMARNGTDRTFGSSDDYTVTLTYVGDCTNPHDIEVKEDDQVIQAGTVGACVNAAVEMTPPSTNPNTALNYSVVKFGTFLPTLQIHLNPNLDWDYGEAPDLVVTMTDGNPSTVEPGDTITYVISLSNDGTKDATGVVLTEMVPAGATFDAGTSDPSWSCSGSSPGSTCTLAVGSFAITDPLEQYTYAVIVDDPATTGEIVNTVSVEDDGANGDDLFPLDNTDTRTTPLTIPCNGNMDLVLTSPSGDPTIVHEACNSITASYTIITGRDVTFKARNLIVFQDGFSVETGAVFKADNDPLAGQEAP